MQISEAKIIKVSWGALIVGASILIGFSAWMTSVDSRASAAQQNIEQLKLDNKDNAGILQKIDNRLQRIEILLEDILTNKKTKGK
jgi:hypothetical protein